MPVLHAAAEALEHVPTTQEGKHQLELSVLEMLAKSYDGNEKFVLRMIQIIEEDPEASDFWNRFNALNFGE